MEGSIPREANLSNICEHVSSVTDVGPSGAGCPGCAASGDRPVALRLCMTCGHVGCCDSSPGRHARAHFHQTGHPIITPLGEKNGWRWCYVDDRYL
ncbi:MAG TPA: UBP-type zinc finger domain-containing protein [Patescibacteria group bacterium]|nr:UBP-type zinc finger domain-containing protein [Patescibacteria group bacterium]